MALTEEDLQVVLEEGIDVENPGHYETLIADLQGNILKGHGRDYSVHLFLEFKTEQTEVIKQWIENFAKSYVKSAKQQSDESVRYRNTGISGGLFANFLLSCKGYEALDIPPFLIPGNQPFRLGMKNRDVNAMLGDPKVETWESGFQKQLHALIILADDDCESLSQVVNKIIQELAEIAELVHRDDGFILRNEAGQIIEHFGFVDGVSQPLYLKQDIIQAQKQDADFSKWDPRASLEGVLTKDPNGKTEDSYGSYLVYRKLEQNVKKFRENQQKLAEKLALNEELTGALMMGRFYDGTPVTNWDSPQENHPHNNFDYENDNAATKCPFHAHVRKMNPRSDTGKVVSSPGLDESLRVERKHRIARRGVSYGSSDLTHAPEKDSGLLFLCFQADIENQFNFMQTRWANAANFVQANVGPDPLIGQPQGIQKWPKQWGGTETIEHGFELCVNMKGGEYFFAPSVSFLQSITSVE